ncbi:hypothetical protein [Halomonas mongoliensis]|uniref:hypothetical protein n=1 Tax=Halomonas mongoliensis TaxID=321265 RepID=UPI00403B34D3
MEKSIGVFESFRLEGRKRGCVVLKENGKIRISRGSESYYVKSGWCSRSDVSAKYVRNKAATRGYLKSLGFPVAEGDIFSALDKEKAADYARENA